MSELAHDERSFRTVEHDSDEHFTVGLVGEGKKCVQTPWRVEHCHVEQHLPAEERASGARLILLLTTDTPQRKHMTGTPRSVPGGRRRP